jgi:hypothetical protein
VKILALHPADDPQTGPWADQKWSRIIDLGLGSPEAYDRWQRHFGCEVISLDARRRGFQEIERVRDLLAMGRGRLVDGDGLDWWELTAILIHSQLETLVLLRGLAETLPGEEVQITRPGFYADALRLLLGKRLCTFSRTDLKDRGAARYLKLGAKFPVWQLVQIFWDKYDPGHEIRGRFARTPQPSRRPVVLLPSAYINVTHTGIKYAKTAPELNFLLVATRQSGWGKSLPPNVRASWLAGYSSLRAVDPAGDDEEILEKWSGLRPELVAVPEIGLAAQLGLLQDFPAWVRQGMKQRDTWKAVFHHEPVQAVLCADDSNPSTHIPLLLAKKFGLPAIACHHGALDGRHMIKRNHADVILAKGEMERDYMTRVCGVSADEVEIGAPASAGDRGPVNEDRNPSAIVLFSEFYEVFSGRPEEFYRDLLPPLADLAISRGKKLVVKLHPAESERQRIRMVNRILSPRQKQVVTVMAGATTPGLLRQAWFAITVLSTIATECAQLRIPCFLCKWLEFWPYGYIDQYIRFGVGYGLESPAEIANIPQILENYEVKANVAANLSRPIEPRRLEQLLTVTPTLQTVKQDAMDRAG